MYRSSREGEYQLGVNVSIDNGEGADNYLDDQQEFGLF